ncbi:MAG: BON domain-containing protein [Gemmataceae bacterium]
MRWLLIALLAWTSVGCNSRDGDLLAQAGHKAALKLGLTRGPSTNTLTGTLRGALGETSLAARVETRLRWDRFLANQAIEVMQSGTATVTLKGQLPEEGMRVRAVEIARATLGVDRVVDELQVGQSPSS